MQPGRKALLKVDRDGRQLQLVVYAPELRMRGQTLTLLSIQNIQRELEEKEMEAWQNLIRVLTHEIMNSVTPIASLEITADPELIEQVLINLLLNAIQALDGREGGRVRLIDNLDCRGNTIIQVTDNGPGILKEVQDRIFIPFFTTKQEGSGIGLSRSRQIMRLHKGSLSVQSQPDEETIFTLHF